MQQKAEVEVMVVAVAVVVVMVMHVVEMVAATEKDMVTHTHTSPLRTIA